MQDSRMVCNSLLRQCQNQMLTRVSFFPKQNNAVSQLRKKISTTNLIGKMSPQEQQQNNKIIQKMRRKYHKKNRQRSIKKAELGQDLLTFTKDEYQKLQIIDDCIEKGIVYRQNVIEQDYPDQEKISAVEKLKKMGRVDDVIDQIKSNLEWGQLKEGEVKSYLIRSKQKGGFLKRSKNSLSSVLVKLCKQKNKLQDVNKHSLNKYYQTLLNKNSFGKKFMASDLSWPKHSQTGMTFAQKLQIIKDQANRNVNRMCCNKTIYMTEQRKDALYECQILRLSKKMLDAKEFQQLHFSVAEKQKQTEQTKGEGQNRSVSQQNNCQAEQILQKNYGRIKQQRKRVIQKLLC